MQDASAILVCHNILAEDKTYLVRFHTLKFHECLCTGSIGACLLSD